MVIWYILVYTSIYKYMVVYTCIYLYIPNDPFFFYCMGFQMDGHFQQSHWHGAAPVPWLRRQRRRQRQPPPPPLRQSPSRLNRALKLEPSLPVSSLASSTWSRWPLTVTDSDSDSVTSTEAQTPRRATWKRQWWFNDYHDSENRDRHPDSDLKDSEPPKVTIANDVCKPCLKPCRQDMNIWKVS